MAGFGRGELDSTVADLTVTGTLTDGTASLSGGVLTGLTNLALTTLDGSNVNVSGKLKLDGEEVWLVGEDQHGNEINILRVDKNGVIDFGTVVQIMSFFLLPDPGVSTIADIELTSDGKFGDKSSIKIIGNGSTLFEARLENDGTGGTKANSAYVIVKNLWSTDLRSEDLSKTGNAQISGLPAKCRLVSVAIEETAGNAADLSLGTSAAGTQIFNAQTCAASSWTVFDNSDFTAAMFSTTAETDLYISSLAWGGADVNIYMVFEKIVE